MKPTDSIVRYCDHKGYAGKQYDRETCPVCKGAGWYYVTVEQAQKIILERELNRR